MRRSVAVSNGTFLGDGVGGAFAGDSKTLCLLLCNASITDRALASESLRGRVTTGFDSGEPFSRSQIDSTTMVKMARNSLCQFWKDSNQNWEVPKYWQTESAFLPCSSAYSLWALAPHTACPTKEIMKRSMNASDREWL